MRIQYGLCKMYMHHYAAMVKEHMAELEMRVHTETYVYSEEEFRKLATQDIYNMYLARAITFD